MKKQPKGRNFKPSMSLAEFAENNNLDHEELVKLVHCTGTLKAQYSRYEVPYYHITDLNHWVKANSIRVVVRCQNLA